jgi:hypothetical protein
MLIIMELEILQNIQKRLDGIEHRLDPIEKGCSKMTGHVDFIERVYRAVRVRLNYVMGSGELPSLENKTLITDKE